MFYRHLNRQNCAILSLIGREGSNKGHFKFKTRRLKFYMNKDFTNPYYPRVNITAWQLTRLFKKAKTVLNCPLLGISHPKLYFYHTKLSQTVSNYPKHLKQPHYILNCHNPPCSMNKFCVPDGMRH